jgi:hypothetical protein
MIHSPWIIEHVRRGTVAYGGGVGPHVIYLDFEFFWAQIVIATLLMRMDRAAGRLRLILGENA